MRPQVNERPGRGCSVFHTCSSHNTRHYRCGDEFKGHGRAETRWNTTDDILVFGRALDGTWFQEGKQTVACTFVVTAIYK